MSDMVIH